MFEPAALEKSHGPSQASVLVAHLQLSVVYQPPEVSLGQVEQGQQEHSLDCCWRYGH